MRIVCQMGDALMVYKDGSNYSPDVLEDLVIRVVDGTMLMYRTMAELSPEADVVED